jgi:hypothetical protein
MLDAKKNMTQIQVLLYIHVCVLWHNVLQIFFKNGPAHPGAEKGSGKGPDF